MVVTIMGFGVQGLGWRYYASFYTGMMMIGLNPGPRARTVKPGPRHLRTRPDPSQNRLGPHKGVPSGEARQCTPAGTEALISALAPTAPPPIKAALNATTVDTRSKTECTSSPQPRKGTRFRRDISSQGPGHTDRRHQLHAVCKCLMG